MAYRLHIIVVAWLYVFYVLNTQAFEVQYHDVVPTVFDNHSTSSSIKDELVEGVVEPSEGQLRLAVRHLPLQYRRYPKDIFSSENKLLDDLHIPLAVRTQDQLNYIPATALDWHVAGDHVYIQLRPTVRWSDGRKLTSLDVSFTLFYLQHTHKQQNLIEDYLSKIIIYDQHRFALVSKEPFVNNDLLDLILSIRPLPAHFYENTVNATKNNIIEIEPTTGPYLIDGKQSSSQQLVLKRKRKWWGDQLTVFSGRFIPSLLYFHKHSNDQYLSFKEGRLDAISIDKYSAEQLNQTNFILTQRPYVVTQISKQPDSFFVVLGTDKLSNSVREHIFRTIELQTSNNPSFQLYLANNNVTQHKLKTSIETRLTKPYRLKTLYADDEVLDILNVLIQSDKLRIAIEKIPKKLPAEMLENREYDLAIIKVDKVPHVMSSNIVAILSHHERHYALWPWVDFPPSFFDGGISNLLDPIDPQNGGYLRINKQVKASTLSEQIRPSRNILKRIEEKSRSDLNCTEKHLGDIDGTIKRKACTCGRCGQ